MKESVLKQMRRDRSRLGLPTILTLIFVVLKLCKVIEWSWIWVLSPLWISIILYLLVFLIIYLICK
jgi:hypothetical protein